MSGVFIYAIGGKKRPIKVGQSSNPAKRCAALRCPRPQKLGVLFAASVPRNLATAVEFYAHWLLREKHAVGEWFNVTAEEASAAILQAIEAVDQGLRARIPDVGVGRKKQWTQDMQARFPLGTFARIAIVLSGKQDRTDFVRSAVEKELKRLERRRAAQK